MGLENVLQWMNVLADQGHVVVLRVDGLRYGNNPRWTCLIDEWRRVDGETAVEAFEKATRQVAVINLDQEAEMNR